MRICQITTVSPTFDTRVFQRECRSLAAAGYEVSLVVQAEKAEVVDGVKIVPLPKVRGRLARIVGYPWKALGLALKEKPDLVHLHDPELLFIGLYLKWFKRLRVVYGVREDHPKCMVLRTYIPAVLRIPFAWAMRMIETFCSRQFDAVVAVTEDIQGNFRGHKRAVLVRNFPVLNQREPVRPATPHDPFRFFYIGIINNVRGAENMVRAIGLLPETARVELVLAGQWGYPEEREPLTRLDGWKRTRELGYVNLFERPEIFDEMDAGLCLIHPTRFYLTSLPLKLFDYMQNRLPSIASNFPDWKPYVEGCDTGISVDPLQPEAIAAAMGELMSNPERCEKMGRNGRAAVLEKFNWAREFEVLDSLYRELASG